VLKTQICVTRPQCVNKHPRFVLQYQWHQVNAVHFIISEVQRCIWVLFAIHYCIYRVRQKNVYTL